MMGTQIQVMDAVTPVKMRLDLFAHHQLKESLQHALQIAKMDFIYQLTKDVMMEMTLMEMDAQALALKKLDGSAPTLKASNQFVPQPVEMEYGPQAKKIVMMETMITPMDVRMIAQLINHMNVSILL